MLSRFPGEKKNKTKQKKVSGLFLSTKEERAEPVFTVRERAPDKHTQFVSETEIFVEITRCRELPRRQIGFSSTDLLRFVMSLGLCLRSLLLPFLLVLLCLLISLLKIHSKPSSDEVYRIKHGRNYNEIGNLDEALSLFHGLLRTRPLPSVVCFTQLLGQIVKMKQYSVVISLFNQMGLRRIPTNNYFCHLYHMGFSLSVLRKFFKSSYEPTTVIMTTLIKG